MEVCNDFIESHLEDMTHFFREVVQVEDLDETLQSGAFTQRNTAYRKLQMTYKQIAFFHKILIEYKSDYAPDENIPGLRIQYR